MKTAFFMVEILTRTSPPEGSAMEESLSIILVTLIFLSFINFYFLCSLFGCWESGGI